MVGQDRNLTHFELLYHRLFLHELAKITEYSFGAHRFNFGTCTLGRGQIFKEKVLEFADTCGFKAYQQGLVDFFYSSPIDEFGFKVDWVNGFPRQIALYLRLTDGIKPDVMGRLTAALSSQWSGVSPDKISKQMLWDNPFCYSYRVDIEGHAGYAIYFETKFRVNQTEFLLSRLLKALEWNSEVKEKILTDLHSICTNQENLCIGIDSDGNTVKIDVPGVSLSKIKTFLSGKTASIERIDDLLSFAKSSRQLKSNYFALKYSKVGFSGWKSYFSILGEN